MFKEDEGRVLRIKIISARNVPGCVSGVVPAANVLCGVSNQTAHTSSIVSSNPIWNHVVEFKGTARKDTVLFILRDADQILGSLQIPVKEASMHSGANTRCVDMLNKDSPSGCLSFTVTVEEKTSMSKKKWLLTTKKIKNTVLSRFGSDPDLLSSQKSSSEMLNSCEPQRNPGIQRCHSYVNERSRSARIARDRHQYVNCSKLRSCGELSSPLRGKHNKNVKSVKKLTVLIQGRNLGKDRSDVLSVHVGGADCTEHMEHISSEKILVKVTPGAPLSPVSVITKSGGQGQQNAKLKVAYESASSSDELRSLRRSVSHGASSAAPRAILRSRYTSAGYSTASSDSGSDGTCVSSKLLFVPPARAPKHSSSSSSSLEPDSVSHSSSPTRDVTTPRDVTPLTETRKHKSLSHVNSGTRARHPTTGSPILGKKLVEIVPTNSNSNSTTDIIPPPPSFAESNLKSDDGEPVLYELSKTELVQEILKLRGAVTDLTKTVNNINFN